MGKKELILRKPTERLENLQTFEAVLAGWLRVWSRLYDKPLTEELSAIYVEILAGIEPQRLAAACMEVSKRAKFFPKPAEIWEVLRTTGKAVTQVDTEKDWQQVLDYLKWHPSPHRKPEFSEQVEQAVRAAGGFDYLSECSMDDLQWAKKRFLVAMENISTAEGTQYLTEGESKKLLAELATKQAG